MRTVGEILKEARTKKELTFSEIEKAIKIRKRVLELLEEGDWSSLAPTYAKGLLRNYALYLGLDEKKILAFFRREYDERKTVVSTKPPVKSRNRFRITP